MPHQGHNIPWNVLASHLQPKFIALDHNFPSDLYLLSKPNQAAQLTHFTVAFARAIASYAATERRKYQDAYPVPRPAAQVLDERVTARITPAVRRWRSANLWLMYPGSYVHRDDGTPEGRKRLKELYEDARGFCAHEGDVSFRCLCAVPLQERRIEAFLRELDVSDPFSFIMNNCQAYYTAEVAKTLLLYGEMDTLFSVCSHPDAQLLLFDQDWLRSHGYEDVAWCSIYAAALDAYLCLNLLRCFPSLWDPASQSSSPGRRDYHDTRLYGKMLSNVTSVSRHSEVSKFPHRAFFGLSGASFVATSSHHRHKQYKATGKLPPYWHSSYAAGMVPFEALTHGERTPSERECDAVAEMLWDKGLPAEVVAMVLERADYAPRGRLVVPNDPFHKENEEQLWAYIKYLWLTMVRCHMMFEALGGQIDWEAEVARCLRQRLGNKESKTWYRSFYDENEILVYEFI